MDPLPISGASFWTTLDAKITAGGGAAHCNDGVLQYVAMKGPFNGPAQFMVQRVATELFSTTVQRMMTVVSNAKAIINGNMWAVPSRNKASLFFASGTQAASQTVPIGEVLVGGVNTGGPSEPSRFQISFKAPSTTGARLIDGYEVSQGDPDAAAIDGLGGLGPLIVGGLKFGNGNLYKAGVPPGAPATGDPGPTFNPFLTQRNNNNYIGLQARGADVGKVAVAVHRASGMLLALVLPDGVSPGMELDVLRDKLVGVGVEDAVFMDGSDSALLAFNGTIVIHNGKFKDQFTTVGLGYGVG